MAESLSTETPAASPPATPAIAPPGGGPVPSGAHAVEEAQMLVNLKQIYDPEIPMNIVDLGLIYAFEWKGDEVTLHMTLTAPGCPVAGILADEVKAALEKVPKVKSATVDMIWEPPWTPERMSDFAKRQFGYM
ncbi:MAG: iron-sulfur cluster assembly protein [Thermoplasmata archaeon]|nr:iron-sulfur cluster assembly protein [Thermoplasmata archaeon]